MSGAAAYQTLGLQSPDSADVTKNGHRRARALYDYDAKDATELSLMADEVTQLQHTPVSFLGGPEFSSWPGDWLSCLSSCF